MRKEIGLTIDALLSTQIEESRQDELNILVDYIQSKIVDSAIINLNFICTHNSRRSHLAQIWASVAASFFGIRSVFCYSGGTEATAMFPMIKKTLEDQGLEIVALSEGPNPVYGVKYSDDTVPLIAFSKKYDHPFNPSSNFAAIMTCSHAEQNCPLIHGAEKRIPVMYEDPKISDGTKEQVATYLRRSEQIAREMLYVFEKVNNNS